MLSYRENYLRNVRLQQPEWIPASVGCSLASLDDWREEMEAVMAQYPELFPDFVPGAIDYQNLDFGPANTVGADFVDAWGCTWRTSRNGIEGVVIKGPLASWDDYAGYQVPDPMIQADRGPADWDAVGQAIRQCGAEGNLTFGGLAHGFLFLRLQYLRGFENAMCDMADDEPRLLDLIGRIDRHSLAIVEKYLSFGVDVMELPEDLGAQKSLIISPAQFRRWIKPSYARLVKPCHEKNTLVYIHSDGYIMDLIDDLLDVGMDIINPQDLCNGIDNLARELKGRACISLDIDRQSVIPYGSRQDIFDLIGEEVRKLGSPMGGLELGAGIYPPTPPKNVAALCEALRKYRTWWWD